ncbi:MAG: HGGxSTG domain-containing protein [Xanthobacteraceae bacterium]
MPYDPIRQADIHRRLTNLAKAQRCGAKTRGGHPCRQAAVRGRNRCRMHGGAKGSGGPLGDRNGNFKHGLRTREAKAIRDVMRAKVRELRGLIQAAKPSRQD